MPSDNLVEQSQSKVPRAVFKVTPAKIVQHLGHTGGGGDGGGGGLHLVEKLLRHVQCAQTPMHLVKAAAPSGSSLHNSMNFGSRN